MPMLARVSTLVGGLAIAVFAFAHAEADDTAAADDPLRLPLVPTELVIPSPTFPSFLGTSPLSDLEDAYRMRGARPSVEMTQNEAETAETRPETGPDGVIAAAVEARRKAEHVRLLAATVLEKAEQLGACPTASEAMTASGPAPSDEDRADAQGWAMRADDGATRADGAGDSVDARIAAAERRADDAEARLSAETAARRIAEEARAAAERVALEVSARRELDEAPPRGEIGQKSGSREGRRGRRS
jgi:hypothetical protein